jgi:hypothetical protein
MATYEITTPDGKVYEVDAPDNMAESEVVKMARAQLSSEKPSAYKEGRQVSNPVARGLANVINGPTFGFGDEIAGVVGGAVKTLTNDKPFSENYRETRDYVRGVQDQYKEDFPIGAVATQFMAAAPTMVYNPLGKAGGAALNAVSPRAAAFMNPANQVAGVVPNVTRTAISGAGYGAVSGAGESKAEDLPGVLMDAGRSAATSAAVSGGLGVVGAGVGGAARNVMGRVSQGRAENYAQQKVAEAISRDARGAVFEGGASNPTGQALARYGKLGDEARVVDAGGENTRQLLDTVATMPGTTKNAVQNAIRSRQAGRAGRLMDAADDALGTRGAGFQQTIEALAESRSKQAAPLYAQLEGATAQVDDDVLALLKKTAGVHGEAQNLYRLQTGEAVSLANLKKGDVVPFSMLDTLKQSLHDAADAAKRQGNKKMALALDDARVSLTGKLDDIAPKAENGQSIYKLARDAYSGPSQLMDAAEAGRTAMKADVFDVASAMKGMSPSEAEAFRVGALQALREKTGTQSGQTSLLKMWMEPSTSARLKQIFGKDYREFAAEVAKEARLKGLEGVGRGSQTANRMFGAGDLDVAPALDAASMVSSAASGNAPGVLAAGARAWNRVATPEAVRDQMGRILLSGGADGRQNLAQMQNLIRDVNRARAQRYEGAGAAIGYGVGGLLNPQQPTGGGLLGQ